MDEFPTGSPVAEGFARPPDRNKVLSGCHVQIGVPNPDKDSPALYEATHGANADPGQWTYMNFGPFGDSTEVKRWMESMKMSSDPLYMAVRDASGGEPLGMISFLNIQPDHRTIELGNVWYVPAAHRSVVNTETIYLLLKECFDELGYRRVEWKCDNLNERSMLAAERLGFTFEGTFRQHFIIKGRNRDTAWYAMLDSEWPRIKKNFEQFLYDSDCERSLRELNK